jgi:glyceraldehyde-3-phosphate dehydrogenase (NADP+)
VTTTASEPLDAAPRPVWTPPAEGYWEGEWKDGRHATTVRDPEDGTPVGRVMDATDEEADRAVAHLAERWRRRAWPLWERRDALDRDEAVGTISP